MHCVSSDCAMAAPHVSENVGANFQTVAMAEEVFRSFTQVKVPIQQCKNTPLQVKVLHGNPT